MKVVTRFAPSPTGYLHIGGARTALFNWYFARHHGGKFLLRIEDTDRERSTQAAVDAIFDGLKWLGLTWDGEPTFQFQRAPRHAEVARQLVERGHGYYCYCSQEELAAIREKAAAEGKPVPRATVWRDRPASEAPAGVKPVIRFKAPQEGETTIADLVQGDVTLQNSQLDDMILLRADGTPTYMLSVVVDDHDMGITHIIRGDDHLTNAFRQFQLYKAMGWDVPEFGHVPLIHGPDGAKLSKRHGALAVDAYRDMGYLPEAMRNYLMRLGWSHGDAEIFSDAEATEWFDVKNIGRSPSRLDFAKLANTNGHYIRLADDARLAELCLPHLEKKLGHAVDDAGKARLVKGMNAMKQRAKIIPELADSGFFYVQPRPMAFDDKAKKLLDEGGCDIVKALIPIFEALPAFTGHEMEASARAYAESRGLGLGKVAQPLRAALTGTTVSPPIFEAAEILGKAETLSRMGDV